MDPMAKRLTRTQKFRAMKKAGALDPNTPGIVMISGDKTRGAKNEGLQEAKEASGEPESHPHMHERPEAKGREARDEDGAKVTSRRKRRPRSKPEVHWCVLA